MRPLRFAVSSIILLLPLVFLSLGSYRLVTGVFKFLNSNSVLAATVSAEATRVLGREVRIQDVKITGNLWGLNAANTVDLRGLFVAESGAPDRFIRADSVVLHYTLDQVLYGDANTPFVTGVQLVHPQLTLFRDNNGRWNFADLARPNAKPGRVFADSISVTSGSILLHDDIFPVGPNTRPRPLLASIDALTGTAEIRADKTVAFDFTGLSDPATAHDFHAVGIVQPHPLSVALRLQANRVNLSPLAERFLPNSVARISSGTADVDLDGLYTPSSSDGVIHFDPAGLSVYGSARLTNVSGSTPYVSVATPVRSVSGTVDVTNTSCSTDLSGKLDDLPLRIVASVDDLPDIGGLAQGTAAYSRALRAHAPWIKFNTVVPNTDLARLYRTLKIERYLPKLPPEVSASLRTARANGTAVIRLDGPLTNPTGACECHLSTAQYDQVYGKNIDAQATLSDHTVVAGIHGTYAGGDARIRATVTLNKEGAFQIEGRGRNLQISKIGFHLNRLEDGTGDLDLAMSGRRGRTPQITTQVQVNDLKLNNQVFKSAYGKAETVGRKLVVRTLRVDDSKGFVQAYGSVDLTNRSLDMKVEADGLDIQSLVAAVRPEAPLTVDPSVPSLSTLEGVAYLRKGVVSGTIDDPVLNAELSAFGVSTGKYSIDKSQASFRLSRTGLVVGRGSLERYPSVISFTGSVVDLFPLDTRPSFDFTVQAKDLDLGYLADIAGLDTSKYVIAGTISTDGPAGIRIVGVKGAVRAQGLSGAGVNSPFSISAHRASINGLKLASAFAEAYYDASGTHVTNARIDVAGGSIKASGLLSAGGNLNAEVIGDSLSVAQLTPVLKDAPAPELDGKLGFAVHITGDSAAVSASADRVSIEDLKYRDLALGSVTSGAQYLGGLVTIHDFALTDTATHNPLILAPEVVYHTDTGAFSSPDAASARAIRLVEFPIKEINDLVLAASNRDDIHALPVSLDQVHGGIAAAIALHGTWEDPAADVVLDTHNVEVKNYLVTGLTGRAEVTKQGVTGQSALMTIRPTVLPTGMQLHPELQEATVSMRDFKALKNGDIRADLDITNVNLAFVQSAIDATAVHPITGNGDKIGMLIGGTLQSPELELSLNLSNVTYMDRTFERVDVDHARVQEGQIQVEGLRFTKIESKSVSYQAEAEGVIRGFTWTAPFLPDTATLDVSAEIPKNGGADARVDLKLLSAMGITLFKDSIGSFGGKLRIVGALNSPRIASGSFGITADKLRAPGIQTGIVGLDAHATVVDDVLTVDKFAARIQAHDRKGVELTKRVSDQIQLSGSIPVGYGDAAARTVPDPLTLTADAVQFEESAIPGARNAGLNGTAAVRLVMTRALLRPLITGTINVTNTSISLPNEFTPPGGTGSPPFVNPRFDITLNLDGKNNRLKNPEIDARVGGSVTLKGELTAPIIHGHVSLNQGYLRVPPRQFDIVPPGGIDLDYGNTAVADAGLSVRINLTARTKLTATSLAGVRKLYTVTVSADGPLTEVAGDSGATQSRMHLDFTTDPNDLAISQQALSERLVPALFGVNTFNQVGQNPGQAVTSAFYNMLQNYVLPGQFNRVADILRLDQLEIGYDPIMQLALIITRQIYGPLYITYNQGLTAESRYYDVKLSFRFRGRYQLSYDFDEQRTQQFLLEGVWRF